MFDVSIIIVSYNTRDLLRNCLASIKKMTTGISYEVVVVDNASSDGSCEMLREQFPEFVLINNRVNTGFGRANNRGVGVSRGKYILFLNSDTELLNNAVLLYYTWFENHKSEQVGAIGCVLLDREMNGMHSFGTFPTPVSLLKKQLPFGKRFFRDEETEKAGQAKTNVDYITGAALFVPKYILDDIGCFDEMFFMYYEDTDLQYRMKQKKIERVIIRSPEIMHFEGKSSKDNNIKRIAMDKSKFIYIRKHYPFIQYHAFKLAYFLLMILRILFGKNSYSKMENYTYFRNVFLG